MKLIVGLGNPGREYQNTRHNVGFMFLDYYLANKNVIWKEKFNGNYCELNIKGEKIIFLKPLSYMNLSGEVVGKFVNYFKINISDVLIISDDLDLSLGNFKLRPKGSSGGHNGLKNIELHLSSSDYKRIKIGISNDKNLDTKDYVLGKFNSEEMKKLTDLFSIISEITDKVFFVDFMKLMNLYNKKNR